MDSTLDTHRDTSVAVADYLTYEHARIFRQLLVKRLGLFALILGAAWFVGLIPTVGLAIGLGMLLSTVVLAGRVERRARLRLNSSLQEE